jgi:hypothetical protein
MAKNRIKDSIDLIIRFCNDGAVRLSHQPWFFLTRLLGGLDFVGGVKTAEGKSVQT